MYSGSSKCKLLKCTELSILMVSTWLKVPQGKNSSYFYTLCHTLHLRACNAFFQPPYHFFSITIIQKISPQVVWKFWCPGVFTQGIVFIVAAFGARCSKNICARWLFAPQMQVLRKILFIFLFVVSLSKWLLRPPWWIFSFYLFTFSNEDGKEYQTYSWCQFAITHLRAL